MCVVVAVVNGVECISTEKVEDIKVNEDMVNILQGFYTFVYRTDYDFCGAVDSGRFVFR